ncbi:MAG: winged helix-turn-helix domain-containing protein [Thermoprotei archaeon]
MVKTAHLRLLLHASEKGILRGEVLAYKLGVHVNTIRKYLKLLEKEGMIVPSGIDEYSLTEKGKKFLESLKKVAAQKPKPHIVVNPTTGEKIPLVISNYEQLYAVLKYGLIPREVIEEYIRRGLLAKWIREEVGDEYLAELLETGSISKPEELLEYLDKVINLLRELK